jgi:tetratricopeptide (TPR) repeat protein
MTEPRPTDPSQPDASRPDLERDAKVDELLLAGLEHYFAGQYHEAINVWGRVLFLDRGHARARAYIERARGALAERQRRTDELVQEGVAALQRGDSPAARELLATAVEQGDPHDMARAYLERLDRLSGTAAGGGPTPAPAPSDHLPRALTARRGLLTGAPRPVRALPIIIAVALIGVAMFVATSQDLLKPLMDLAWRPPAAASAVSVAPDVLTVPGSAELALARARELMAPPAGRLKAALAALDGVAEGDPLMPDVLRLRSDIQRALLDSLQPGTAPPTPPRPEGSRQ